MKTYHPFTVILLFLLAMHYVAPAQFYTQRSPFLKANSNWYLGKFALDQKQQPLQPYIANANGISVSDPQTGVLRFLAAGRYLLDRNLQLMTGIVSYDRFKYSGAGNSMTVIPFLDNPDKYYFIFVTDDPEVKVGYAVVDMSLNGGLGNLDTGSISFILDHTAYDDALAEIMDVVPGNNCDLWLLVAETGFAAKKLNVLAYHITASGIDTNPIVSIFNRENNSDWSWGFQASPNRDLIAFFTYKYYFNDHYEPDVELGFLSFNPENGVAGSNPMPPIRMNGGSYGQVYGTFTPDNNYFIANNGIFDGATATIYQYDLDAYAQGYNRQSLHYSFTYQHVPARIIDVYDRPVISFKPYEQNVFFSIPWADESPCTHVLDPGFLDVKYGGVSRLGRFYPAQDMGWKQPLSGPELDLMKQGVLPPLNSVVYPFPPGDTVRSVYFDTVFCYDPEHIYFPPATLQARPGFSDYLWDDGTTGMERTISKPGKYWVTYNGSCNTRQDSFIYRYRILEKMLPPDSIICDQRYPVPIKAKGVQPLLWDDNSTEATREIYYPGTYWISGRAEGCPSFDTIRLSGKYCPCSIAIPNAFTPNSDGLNDFFKPLIAPGCVPSGYNFQVFNRWGQLVYSSFNEFDQGWDGTYKGNMADMGTYFYEVRFKSRFLEQPYYQRGELTLVR